MDLFLRLKDLYKNYGGEKGIIGKTFLGREIPFFAVEKSLRPVVICQYAIHAREYITTYLAFKQMEYFERYGRVGKVYFIPAVNIDGVKICLNGKPLYKANARGVDLNVNFDAEWGKGKNNKTEKADSDYIGEYPFSEPETTALANFTLDVMPDITLSYHSKGEEIYYYFGQNAFDRERDYAYAKAVAESTGYSIKLTPDSAGGYKDWCIKRLKIPSLTIEVGNDVLRHPLKEDCLGDIFSKNKRVINVVTEKFYDRKIYGYRNSASEKGGGS